jgi:dihydroflavonol-4-reductase
MRALVIGASGFIGLHVVDRLLAAGFQVRATCRKSTPTIFLRRRPVELVPGSLEDEGQLRDAMRDCDAVFVTGGYYPRYSLDLAESLQRGVSGVRNACNAALHVGVPRFVYTSTIATLDSVVGRAANEDDLGERAPAGSVYRAVKWAMEREVDAAAARGLSAVTLLPGGCIGEGDLRLGTGGLIVLLVRGELPFCVDGTVNLVDVHDVAEAHLRALRAPRDRYCLAGADLRFPELAAQIVERYGGHVPPQITRVQAQQRADAEERVAAANKARVRFPRELVDVISTGQPVDCSRAEHELGLQFSALSPALERAHTFYQRFGYLPRQKSAERHSA